MAEHTQTGGRAATGGVIDGGTALAVGMPKAPLPPGFTWQALAHLARLETGHTPSRRVIEYWNGSIPWIGIRDATENHGRTLLDTKQHISQAGVENSSTRLLPAQTVCLSRTASVGYVVTMGVPMCTSQDFVNWVCGTQLDHRYLALVLRLEQETVRRFASGTTHQTVYFPEAKAFHIAAPSLAGQRAIADVLGALDDKDEANRRQSSLIAALLKLKFAVITERCLNRKSLAEMATFIKGVSYRSSELSSLGDTCLVTLKSVGRQGGYQSSGLKPYTGKPKRAQVLKPGELVVAQTDLTQAADVIGRVVRVPTDVNAGRLVASLDLVIARPRDGISPEYLYGLLLEERFRQHCRSRSSGTTVLHLSREALPQYEAPYVPIEEQERFALLARPLLDKHDALGRESTRLAALRDALLPELLSGRMRVPQASEVVESAMA